MGIILRSTQSVELRLWRTEPPSDPLLKEEGLYMVFSQYMRTLLQMQNPQVYGHKKKQRKILRIQ